jgi:hypothetical protein
MKILLTTFAIIILSVGCQSSAKKTSNVIENESLPEDFMNFYTKFHQDSQYQLGHILFPFKSRKYETKDAYMTLDWTAETWKIHHPFDSSEDAFTREFTIADEKYITEIIFLNTGGFGLERRFAFIDTAWYLVMYNEYHQPNDGQ